MKERFFKSAIHKKRICIGALALAAALLTAAILCMLSADRKAGGYQSAVLVTTENLKGQGVCYRAQGGMLYIVTAAHVVAGVSCGEQVEVANENGAARAVLVYVSQAADLAFLELERGGLKGLRPISLSRKIFDDRRVGEPLMAVGFLGEEENGVTGRFCVEGSLENPWIYLEDFSLDMMLAQLPAKKGMSGCGVFNENGVFYGILCGVSEENTAALLPLSVIESEWQMLIHFTQKS